MVGDQRDEPTSPAQPVEVAGPVERMEPGPPGFSDKDTTAPERNHQAIAVMDFANVTGHPDSAWLSAGIAETVTADLRALGLL